MNAISMFQYFGDRGIEKAEVLDIKTQGVSGPKIPLREKITIMFEGRVEVKDMWIKYLRFQ